MALYFHFLSFYTKQLLFISVVGILFYFYAPPYSNLYSSILLLWSITFVEWWRIKQRQLSVRWGTKGSFRVEKRRAQYVPLSWWRKDVRALASLPVILFFASVLAVLLTAIFVFEAFVTHLYTGPGHKLIVSCVYPAFAVVTNASTGIQPNDSIHCPCSAAPQHLSLVCGVFHQLGKPRPPVYA